MKRVKLILTLLSLLQSALLLAQVDLQNTGTLFITGGTDILYVNGALTNTNSGALTNNGNLYVLRNLTNGQVLMPVGTGTLYLNGSVAQTIGGTQPFRTFNLNSNNSAGVTLNANLSVSGAHTFTDGVITTSATPNYLIYEAGSSYSGAADSRHVNGWVKKIGNTNFTFPVGNGTYLRNTAISNLSASSEFNCKHFITTTNPTNVSSPILLVDIYEYWDITRVSGGTVDLTLNWDNSKIQFPSYPLGNIKVVNYAGGLWTSRGGSASGNITTTGTITGTGISSFGLHTFGSTDWFVAAKFLKFTAQRKQNYSQLNWSVSKDVQANKYEVERSEDAINFRKIAAIDVINNFSTNYQYNDQLPLNGTGWYRIKSIDKNGQQNFSTVIALSDRKETGGFYVINNPAYQNIFISTGNAYAGKYEYSLINAAGQQLLKGNINATGGGITTIPLTASVVPGIYILDIKNNIHRLTEKIIVR
ncbi:MAG: T9SS type A sorting domain-containing protein [Chitinophagaceae bacterium]